MTLVGRAWIAVALQFLMLPLVVTILFAFQRNHFASFPLMGWTLQWFGNLFEDGLLINSLGNSLTLAPSSASVATLLAVPAAYGLQRAGVATRVPLQVLFIAPILVPPVILGVALLATFSKVGLSGSLAGVFVAHVLLAFPIVLAVVQLRLAQIPRSLEEAAWDLGASRWQGFLMVILPSILPSIAVGWLLAFTLCFDEFVVAWFVSGFEQTLPVATYTHMASSADPTLNAMGTIVAAISLAVLIVVQLIGSFAATD